MFDITKMPALNISIDNFNPALPHQNTCGLQYKHQLHSYLNVSIYLKLWRMQAMLNYYMYYLFN